MKTPPAILLFLAFSTLFALIPATRGDSSFSVTFETCRSSWYCSDYLSSYCDSRGCHPYSCGERSCVDANACGLTTGKPDEYLACPTINSGRRRGYTENTTSPPNITSPPLPILTSADFLNLELDKPTGTTSFFVIADENMLISIAVSENNQTTTNVTLLPEYISFSLKKGKQKNIILTVNAPNLQTTHIITVSSGLRTKKIPLYVTYQPTLPTFDINISQNTDENHTITISLSSLLALFGKPISINYLITAPDGKAISTKTVSLTPETEPISESFEFPNDLPGGYYAATVTITDNTGSASKNTLFTIIPKEYAQTIKEEPSFFSRFSSILFGALIIFSLTVFLFIRYEKKQETDALVPLHEYINKKLDQRILPEEIKKQLKAVGWKEEIIDQEIEKIRQAKEATQNIAPPSNIASPNNITLPSNIASPSSMTPANISQQ